MNNGRFFAYLIVMAGITYLIRMIPFVLFKKEIKNKYILSFLHYIPYAVLSVMTIPAIFYSTSNIWSAVSGTIVAVIFALMEKSLLTVASVACVAVFVTEYIMKFL